NSAFLPILVAKMHIQTYSCDSCPKRKHENRNRLSNLGIQRVKKGRKSARDAEFPRTARLLSGGDAEPRPHATTDAAIRRGWPARPDALRRAADRQSPTHPSRGADRCAPRALLRRDDEQDVVHATGISAAQQRVVGARIRPFGNRPRCRERPVA